MNFATRTLINLFCKGVYPYEYMTDFVKFNETSLLDKEDMTDFVKLNETSLSDKEAFYSSLNTEDIADIDHRHLGDYHDLYVQSDTLFLEDVFENFTNMCIKVYELDPANFLSAPGLAWQACLKKTEVNLELLTDADMLLMIQKGIRGGICPAIHRYAKTNINYMKNYDENEESSFLEYLDANNLYGWAMSEPLPVNNLFWIENASEIDEDYMKSYDENSDKGYILEVDVEYPKNLHDLHSYLPFLPERMKIDK